MMGIEPAGQRAECGQDQLRRGDDKAAARDMPSLEMEPKLGMIMSRHLGSGIVAHRFMAQDNAADLNLILDASAAMVGKARVMVPYDPCPIEP